MRDFRIVACLLVLVASCSSWSGQSITNKAAVVKGSELDSIRKLFYVEARACRPVIKVLKAADTSKYSLTSSIDTNTNILQLTLPVQKKVIRTIIRVTTSVGDYIYTEQTGDSVLCAQSERFWI